MRSLPDTWLVPEGRKGDVVHISRDQGWVEIRHMLPRPGRWAATEAIVRHDEKLEICGQVFDTPSGAGKHVKGAVTNASGGGPPTNHACVA